MNIEDLKKIKALSLLVTALFIWGLSHAPFVEGYIGAVQTGVSAGASWMNVSPLDASGEPAAVAAWSQTDVQQENKPLLEEIRREADRTRIEPVDAKVDSIWKAIPGLNGREVDVDKTYHLALRQPSGTPISYVYKEVSPAVGLDNLGAQPVYRGNPGKKMISLMINVAWGDEFLPRMLETLRKENVHATFFFDGTWLSTHLETAKAIGAEGHELSNHAYSHKNMSQLSRGRAEEEIRKTEDLLRKIGVDNKLFAPPSGDYDQETVDIAHGMNLRTILWTIDTVDWRKPSPETVVARVTSKLEPGALILMHPTSSSMLSLESIIKYAKSKGYALGTVSQLISPERLPELETSLSK